ncbi:MAG: metal-dependent transcriptional regulator [Chloroflexi bacterium]|nr:metal-dependent transcriptional regulator [Chloroflexota bacterium]MCL5108874.1 metal-dependent transcriptional regulator [Chloroflexota bacterium]
MPTPTIEEYLEAIYTMAGEGRVVIGARLAESLAVSPPTVTSTVQRMRRDGLVAVSGEKEIRLTEKGEQAVEQLLRRHRLAERLLVDVLGLPWFDVHEDACRLEHAISSRVEERLAAFLGEPGTCPHGNPIPGHTGSTSEIPLPEAQPQTNLVLRRVAKRAESETGLLRYLDEHGLRPGVSLVIQEQAPFNGPVVVRTNGRDVALSREIAALLYCEVS